ncbi:phosphate:H+ symporter [Sclerotinia borealis F-4128]|uniref:Phosphate:H+ symporter n=1 Tax=Sclerotinia borealis (strain F-4128) TaxID=1432307 RepID=W9CUG5_SCLBF|nr:phosphate:H+ symporter [Sclerotinia borealis F-4128]
MDPLPEPALPLLIPNTKTYGGNAAFHNFNNDYSHIVNPNLRRRLALSEIDKVPFGWYHVRAVVVAGIGFFTDSYDIFAINLITSMLGMVFWQGSPSTGGNYGVLPTGVNTAIKAATSGGAVIGQVGFGWLADSIGRRKMYGVELAIIILATLAQTLSASSPAISMTGVFIFWRIVMGIGIGGDYPLSAVITSEFAPTRWRGGMMAAVFSMQGAGQFAAALVALITTVAFKNSFINTSRTFDSCDPVCQLAADRAWRIIVGFGAVPACFAFYYRITIPETPRYTFDIARDIEKADADIKAYMNNDAEGRVDPVLQQKTKADLGQNLSQPSASWSDIGHYFSQWDHAKFLIGTTLSWFFLDLAYYGLGLNASTVLAAIGYGSGPTLYHILIHAATGNLVLVCAGSIPGYWLSVFTIDTIGRKPIQIFGFAILTLIFCIIGFLFNSLTRGALLALYILAQLFFNFGPNTTTFIIPGECFPTRYRSTGHGLSAASGKIGAIIAQVISQPLLAKGASPHCEGADCSPWLNHLMQIFALFMLCGTIVSFLVQETKGRTLEELAGEPNSSLDSIAPTGTSFWARNNPFTGGKPAGFSRNLKKMTSPILIPKSPGTRGKRERVGIMTSTELLPRKHNDSPKISSRGHTRGGSGDTRETRETRVEAYVHEVAEDERNASLGGAGYGLNGGVLPGWGTGWQVQRGGLRGGERVESIQLMDVGKLLK